MPQYSSNHKKLPCLTASSLESIGHKCKSMEELQLPQSAVLSPWVRTRNLIISILSGMLLVLQQNLNYTRNDIHVHVQCKSLNQKTSKLKDGEACNFMTSHMIQWCVWKSSLRWSAGSNFHSLKIRYCFFAIWIYCYVEVLEGLGS
jgi:hypothetical protein